MTRESFMQHIASEQESLRRFLLALCYGNKADADDLAQETLIKAYLSLDKYKEYQRFSSWLMKIAHNTFLDSRRTSHPSDTLATAERLTADRCSDEGFRYQELYTALDTLPRKERSSVLLFYMQGYTIKEIGQITNNSESAVKKQLERGRDKLKTIIKR